MARDYPLGRVNVLLSTLETKVQEELTRYGYKQHIVTVAPDRFEQSSALHEFQAAQTGVHIAIFLRSLKHDSRDGGGGLVQRGLPGIMAARVRQALAKAKLANKFPLNFNPQPLPLEKVFPTEVGFSFQLQADIAFLVSTLADKPQETMFLLHSVLEMLFLMVMLGDEERLEKQEFKLISNPLVNLDPSLDRVQQGNAKPMFTGGLNTAYRIFCKPTEEEPILIRNAVIDRVQFQA